MIFLFPDEDAIDRRVDSLNVVLCVTYNLGLSQLSIYVAILSICPTSVPAYIKVLFHMQNIFSTP